MKKIIIVAVLLYSAPVHAESVNIQVGVTVSNRAFHEAQTLLQAYPNSTPVKMFDDEIENFIWQAKRCCRALKTNRDRILANNCEAIIENPSYCATIQED